MKNIKDNRSAPVQLIQACAAIIGFIHFFNALGIIFTFRNNQPLNEIVWTFTGYVTTLPVAYVSKYSFRIAGILYIVFAFISLAMILFGLYDWKTTIWFIFYTCIITASIGIAMILVNYRKNENSSSTESNQ